MNRIGTAGWATPRELKNEDSQLQRYSRTFSCVEINSSFYREHRSSTWLKWARDTPAEFRFSIKAPKAITHQARLCDTEPLLRAFFSQIEPLGQKRGPILFQLPPSLKYDLSVAGEFFTSVRKLYESEVVLEPRHSSWFCPEVDAMLQSFRVARVAADPPKGSVEAGEPGGYTELAYYRLHGSPHMYYSNYEDESLEAIGLKIKPHGDTWVIFDNTAAGKAYSNALQLQTLVKAIDPEKN